MNVAFSQQFVSFLEHDGVFFTGGFLSLFLYNSISVVILSDGGGILSTGTVLALYHSHGFGLDHAGLNPHSDETIKNDRPVEVERR